MNTLQAIILAIIEGLTEFLPISSTAHMGFTASLLGMEESDFLKMFQVSIQFGAILAIVVLYWKKFFNFENFKFYFKLVYAVIPALVLGYLFDDKIEAVLGNQIAISSVLVLGGVVLLFVDNWFKNPTILDEKDISIKKAVIIGFWQCLAMLSQVYPGTAKYTDVMPKVPLNYPKSILKVAQKYYKSIPKVSQKYPKSFPKLSKKYPKSIQK